MKLEGWGRYPVAEAAVRLPLTVGDCAQVIDANAPVTPRGLGRSYGDSSLGAMALATRHLDHLLAFDVGTGDLHCQSGVSLASILEIFVPRGWFLPVTPGSRFVTIGGAIASDVHGKNHHQAGSFSDHVSEIELLLGNGERVRTTRTEHPELFRATCGGMGLTGLILSARVRLLRIGSSDINQTTIAAPNLDVALDAFAAHASATYSVAWIDCLARGDSLGRAIVMLGEHAQQGPLEFGRSRQIPVPFDAPAGLLNRTTIGAFNALYYAAGARKARVSRQPLERYFYPLDGLAHWNRLYGRAGFVQHQFVIPQAAGTRPLRDIVARIAESGRGSFLAVLKAFGPGNANYLSFPVEGWTLALDFKAEPETFRLLDELDRRVIDAGGRLYLTKDARMSEHTFKAGYPRWTEFEAVRARYHAIGRFGSRQSRRLGLG